MKKIITPLGALISLIFVPSTWLYFNQARAGYASGQLSVGLYEMYRAAPVLGFIILGLIVAALILILIPFFLRNPFRKAFVVGLSLIALMLLLAFLSFKDEVGRNGEPITLGWAWFGSLFGFFIAFLGAFIKTKTAQSETGAELPAKSSQPMISAVVLAICLPVSIFYYFFLMPPLSAFPLNVDGLSRASRVLYREDETYPGVYMAAYGESVLYTAEKKNSAEEAKAQVAKVRESVKRDSERGFNEWKNRNKLDADSPEAEYLYRKDDYAVFLAPEDNPENDYTVDLSASRASVVWADKKWFYTVSAPKAYEQSAGLSAAQHAFDFARAVPFPPRGTTAPSGENRYASSLYSFVRFDLPMWFGERALLIVPLLIAAPFLLLTLFRLVKRKSA